RIVACSWARRSRSRALCRSSCGRGGKHWAGWAGGPASTGSSSASRGPTLVCGGCCPNSGRTWIIARCRSSCRKPRSARGVAPPRPEGGRPPDPIIPLQRIIQPYRNVFLVPASNDPEVLKPMLTQRIAAAMGKPLSEEERKNTMNEAMVWLKQLAAGEVPGYRATGAESAIVKVMRNEDLNALAVQAAGRLPGRAPQRELATLVLDEAVRAAVRASAARGL